MRAAPAAGQKSPATSSPPRVPAPRQTAGATLLLTKRTLPSSIAAFTPLVWKLRAVIAVSVGSVVVSPSRLLVKLMSYVLPATVTGTTVFGGNVCVNPV